MTKLPTFEMLDCSTGHLTEATRRWMDQPENQAKHGFMARDEGYAICASPALVEELPEDLGRVLLFARHNQIDWVLFDMDAEVLDELPYFEDGTPEVIPDVASWPSELSKQVVMSRTTVRIKESRGGVIVDIFLTGRETEEPLETCYLSRREIEEALEEDPQPV